MSDRVIRVRRGAGADAPRPRAPVKERPRSGRAESYVFKGVKALTPETVEWFNSDEVAEMFMSHGFHEVRWHPGSTQKVVHGAERHRNRGVFHIYNHSTPRAHASARQGYDRLYVDSTLLGEDETVRLDYDSRLMGFITGSPQNKWRRVRDAEKPIGMCRDNICVVFFNIEAQVREQHVFITHIMRFLWLGLGWVRARIERETLSTALQLNVDEVAAAYRKMYNPDRMKGISDRLRDEAVAECGEAYNGYLRVVDTHRERLLKLDGLKDQSDEAVRERAEAMLSSLRANPIIGGARITPSQMLRVITKPIKGGRVKVSEPVRVMMFIPVAAETMSKRLMLKQVSDMGVSNFPRERGMFYDSGTFCLGSIRYDIDRNMWSGDWDVAVLMVLRGLLGAASLSRWMKHYRDAAPPDEVLMEEAEVSEPSGGE